MLNPKLIQSLGDTFTIAYQYVQNHLRQLIDNEQWEHLILNEKELQEIIAQTAEYKRLCRNENFEDVDYKDTLVLIVKFWKKYYNELSAWWILVEPAYLTQPSSAAAERTLSIFTIIMTNNMKNSLTDVIEGSMMLVMNKEEENLHD